MSRFITAKQLADDATFLVKDYQQMNRMRFNKLLADFVLPDLNIQAVKDVKREFMYVNKRLNSIELPCDCEKVQSVSWVDDCGKIHPLMINQALHDDIVDLGAKNDCACSCGGDLCNMIKGYESVIIMVDAEMPDGTICTFETVNRKWYDADGVYYEQTQAPERLYEDGVWVDTVIATTDRELCRLELAPCGCVSDCDENYRKVVSCGCSFYYCNRDCRVHIPYSAIVPDIKSWYHMECGAWFAGPCTVAGSYNLNDAGNRIIFPPHFAFDRVLVRYYYTPDNRELKIPRIAAYAAIMGIMYYDIAFDNNQAKMALLRQQQFTNSVFALILELNKYTLNNMYNMMAPKVYIPS